MITINVDKAKEVWKNKLREARSPILTQLDIEYMRTLEQGGNTATIVAKKQELRDITKHENLLNAETLEEIKQFWPDILDN